MEKAVMAEFLFILQISCYFAAASLFTYVGYADWKKTGSGWGARLALIGPVWPLAIPIAVVYALYWAIRGLAVYAKNLGPLIRTAFDKED